MEKQKQKFSWGVATSSYQTEGNNINADWWKWETRGKVKNPSGKSSDYWNRWKEDHELLSQLGVDTFRMSLEWSRLEPEEGKFSEEAFVRYKEILTDLKRRGIKTQVTFWWWVSPLWFEKKYGFHKKSSIDIFVRYVKKSTEELGSMIDIFQILNEPMVPLGQGYLTGLFPPGKKNPFLFWLSLKNIAQAYVASYKTIHAMKPDSIVGMTHLYNWYESGGINFIGRIAYQISKWFRVAAFNRRIKGYQDFFGLNYYRLGKINLLKRKSDKFNFFIEEDESNVMGWIDYPEGIYKGIMEAHRDYKLPIYVTENGYPTRTGIDDYDRIDFIKNHLFYLEKAIHDGADVRGYNHWSLTDNFEWLYGYDPRFGLVEIDYKTLQRKPRKSFWEYKKIIEENKNW